MKRTHRVNLYLFCRPVETLKDFKFITRSFRLGNSRLLHKLISRSIRFWGDGQPI